MKLDYKRIKIELGVMPGEHNILIYSFFIAFQINFHDHVQFARVNVIENFFNLFVHYFI